ncbi:hypothetical protein ACNKHN_12400 [Shigella flexneri]
MRRPFIALNLPEKPEIANELVSLECLREADFRSKEWSELVVTDPKAVKELTRYSARISAAIEKPAACRMKPLRLRGLRCPFARTRTWQPVPRLAMYAHKEDCGSLLVQINHPQVIRTLLLVADKKATQPATCS